VHLPEAIDPHADEKYDDLVINLSRDTIGDEGTPVDGGSMVLTAGSALHLADSIATITFTAVRDWVELEWLGTAWGVIAYSGVTFT
jgi:hypothetical protein